MKENSKSRKSTTLLLFLRFMQIYSILFLITIVKLFGAESAYAQSVTLNVENLELKTILSEIEKKTDHSFFYNNSLIDVSKKATVNADNVEISLLLSQIFSDKNIGFKIFKNQIVLFPKGDLSVQAIMDEFIIHQKDDEDLVSNTSDSFLRLVSKIAQDPLTGTVTDQNGLPLPGASVIVKGTTKGVQTDFDGNYSIIASSDQTLVFSYIGYAIKEVSVGTKSIINVSLQEDAEALEEVIVTAYGTSTKEAFTGSASVIRAEDLAMRTVTSPIAAIEGRATGVQFTAAQGPGSSPGIVIRGVGTLNGNTDPLFIVDGIQYEGALNTINQEDIESFTILKDAASTSLYGSRAANGVVIITTKSGSKNEGIKVNASMQYGLVSTSIPFYDELTPGQYYETMWEALKNSSAGDGDPAFASANIYNSLGYNPFNVPNDQIVGIDGRLNPNADVIYQSLDWYDVLSRTGVRQNYNVNVSGGGEDHKIFFSASYLDEESFVVTSGFNRLTTRLNAEFDVNDNLTMGGSANVTITEAVAPSSAGAGSIANPFGFAKNIGSIYPVYVNDLQGNLVRDDFGNLVFDNGEGFSEFNIGSRPINQGRNALQELLLNDERDRDNTYGFRFFGDLEILDGLNLRVNYGRDINEGLEKEFENAIIGDAQPDGRFSETRSRRQVENFNQILTYRKSFNNVHNLDITAGHESFDRTFTSNNGLATVQASNGIFEFDNFSNIVRLGGSSTRKSIEGYFSRINYNFDNKYYISGSVRRDGSSVFSADRRWGSFYSVGASWRIDQENFLKNSSVINQLKLRGSYGEVGNDDLNDFFLSQARFSITSNAASPAIIFSDIGNSDLQWETIENFDVALEFTLFNNFLEGSVEYYKRNSTDLLYELPIAPSNGLNIVPTNVGDMSNSGWEVALTTHLFNKNDFRWDVTLQASTFKNEITSLPAPFIDDQQRWEEGRSRFDFFLLRTAGVDPANGDQLFLQYELDEEGNSVPVLDANGEIATTNDWQDTERAYTGDSAVPDLLGSVANSINYKGFSFDFLINYGIGGKLLDFGYAAMLHSGTFGRSYNPDILNAWRQPGDITDVPRLEAGNPNLVRAASERFLTDASFWALRNVNLGYTFKGNIADQIGVDNLRVSVSGENLYTKSGRTGLNPQFELEGTPNGNDFGPPRIISFGLNVAF